MDCNTSTLLIKNLKISGCNKGGIPIYKKDQMFYLGVWLSEGANHRALAPHFWRPFLGPPKSSSKGSIANAGPWQATRPRNGRVFRDIRRSFPVRRKIVQKKCRLILPVRKKGLYICTPQTRVRKAPGERKTLMDILKKRKQKFF